MNSVIRTGKITVDLSSRAVEVRGQRIPVTQKEYRILELLSLHKGKPLSRDKFVEHLYGGTDRRFRRTINVFVCHLRKKLAAATGGDDYIVTLHGRGYELRDPEK